PFRRLTRSDSVGFRLNPVTDGVPHQVEQWIHEAFDQELIYLSFLTTQVYDHAFVSFPGDVSHHETHAFEDLGNGNHAHAHHIISQIFELLAESRAHFLQLPPVVGGNKALDGAQVPLKPGPADYKVANQQHQLIESREVDSYRDRWAG